MSRSFRLDNLLAAFVDLVFERFGIVTVMGIVCLQLPLGPLSVSTDAIFVYVEDIRPLVTKVQRYTYRVMNFLCLETVDEHHGYLTNAKKRCDAGGGRALLVAVIACPSHAHTVLGNPLEALLTHRLKWRCLVWAVSGRERLLESPRCLHDCGQVRRRVYA